jgi:hypothetical protein
MSAHLTPGQFVDLAEGTQPESAVSHLAACAACRTQLADLRAMMTAAAGVDVVEAPEPSPLYQSSVPRVRRGGAGGPAAIVARTVMQPLVVVPSLAGALAVYWPSC